MNNKNWTRTKVTEYKIEKSMKSPSLQKLYFGSNWSFKFQTELEFFIHMFSCATMIV